MFTVPCARIFHCITLIELLGAPSSSFMLMNFLWNGGGLSLRASLHCWSSSTGSGGHPVPPLCSWTDKKDNNELHHHLTIEPRCQYCTGTKVSYLAEIWIQGYVPCLVQVQVGWREWEGRTAAANYGLSQSSVQPGGSSTHWTGWWEGNTQEIWWS